MSFALVDESQGATTADGAALTPTVLESIASACLAQLNRDVSSETGGGPYLVRVSTGADIQPGEIVFSILPTLPNAPGAIAYHDVLGNGVPVAYDAITLSDSLTGPGNSLSVAISHELCETAGDPGCNRWADRGDGTEVALEQCDAVESQTYDVGLALATGIHVSNFVLRSFFEPGAPPPYDFMTSYGIATTTAPPGPMQTAPSGGGDYQIVRQTSPQSETQVTAEGNPDGRRPWRHGSRRHRRGVQP
jgi:hypothetical protein